MPQGSISFYFLDYCSAECRIWCIVLRMVSCEWPSESVFVAYPTSSWSSDLESIPYNASARIWIELERGPCSYSHAGWASRFLAELRSIKAELIQSLISCGILKAIPSSNWPSGMRIWIKIDITVEFSPCIVTVHPWGESDCFPLLIDLYLKPWSLQRQYRSALLILSMMNVELLEMIFKETPCRACSW